MFIYLGLVPVTVASQLEVLPHQSLLRLRNQAGSWETSGREVRRGPGGKYDAKGCSNRTRPPQCHPLNSYIYDVLLSIPPQRIDWLGLFKCPVEVIWGWGVKFSGCLFKSHISDACIVGDPTKPRFAPRVQQLCYRCWNKRIRTVSHAVANPVVESLKAVHLYSETWLYM